MEGSYVSYLRNARGYILITYFSCTFLKIIFFIGICCYLDELISLILGQDDRPEYPHKVIKTEVLNNPFPDILPRLAIDNEIPKEERKKKKKGTK